MLALYFGLQATAHAFIQWDDRISCLQKQLFRVENLVRETFLFLKIVTSLSILETEHEMFLEWRENRYNGKWSYYFLEIAQLFPNDIDTFTNT